MSSRMARAFLGPDVRGVADLLVRHVRFCIVRSFGLNTCRTEVERNRVNSMMEGDLPWHNLV